MWIYESHTGGLFVSCDRLSWKQCYCPDCGDSDEEIGFFDTPDEFLAYYADHIYIPGDSWGYDLEYIRENVLGHFDKQLTLTQAEEIVLRNRSKGENDEM